jgi:hypothetical protein
MSNDIDEKEKIQPISLESIKIRAGDLNAVTEFCNSRGMTGPEQFMLHLTLMTQDVALGKVTHFHMTDAIIRSIIHHIQMMEEGKVMIWFEHDDTNKKSVM